MSITDSDNRERLIRVTTRIRLIMTLALCIFIVFMGFLIVNERKDTTNDAISSKKIAVKNVIKSQANVDIPTLETRVNDLRQSKNLPILYKNDQLVRTAQERCDDMVAKDYFAHVAPDGTQWYETLRKNIPYYQNANENIASNFNDADGVFNGWVNSPDHLKALVDPTFTEAGTATCTSSNYQGHGQAVIVVQEYLQPTVAAPSRSLSGAPYNVNDTSTWPLCDPGPYHYNYQYQTTDCLPNPIN